jgi:hypothetical protein
MPRHRAAHCRIAVGASVLSRIGSDAGSREPITSRDEWFSALADVFDLRFDHSRGPAIGSGRASATSTGPGKRPVDRDVVDRRRRGPLREGMIPTSWSARRSTVLTTAWGRGA